MKVICFDLETTGTNPEFDRIVEFCFIELNENLEELGRWSKLVHPQKPIPQETVDIHGITDEMVANEKPFPEYATRIQKLIEGATLIGHNVKFDVSFIHAELRRAGQPGLRPDHPTIDTIQIERNVNSHRLGECYKRYNGEPLDDAHRSEADTAATVDVLRGQLREHADSLPSGLENLHTDKLHKHFNPDAQTKTWLDHEHRFYRDDMGVVRLGFGKHRDQAAKEQTSYLLWMRDKDFSQDVKAVINDILGDRFEPSASSTDVSTPPDGQRTL